MFHILSESLFHTAIGELQQRGDAPSRSDAESSRLYESHTSRCPKLVIVHGDRFSVI